MSKSFSRCSSPLEKPFTIGRYSSFGELIFFSHIDGRTPASLAVLRKIKVKASLPPASVGSKYHQVINDIRAVVISVPGKFAYQLRLDIALFLENGCQILVVIYPHPIELEPTASI